MQSSDETPPAEQQQVNRRKIADYETFFNSQFDATPVDVAIGKCKCSNTQGVMLVTTVGTGMAVCINDPNIRAGGVANILLPPALINEFPHFTDATKAMRDHCDGIIGSLVQTLVKLESKPDDIRVKLFGGGRMGEDESDEAGMKMNIYVREYLTRRGLTIMTEDVGEAVGRRVHFFPTNGKCVRRLLKRKSDRGVLTEREQTYLQSL